MRVLLFYITCTSTVCKMSTGLPSEILTGNDLKHPMYMDSIIVLVLIQSDTPKIHTRILQELVEKEVLLPSVITDSCSSPSPGN